MLTNILLGAEGSRLVHPPPPLDGGSQLSALFLSFLPPLDDIVALKGDHTPSVSGAASFGGWKVPGALDSWLLSLAPRPELTCPSCTAQCDLSWMGSVQCVSPSSLPR